MNALTDDGYLVPEGDEFSGGVVFDDEPLPAVPVVVAPVLSTEILMPLVSKLRTDVHAEKKGKEAKWTDKPLTLKLLERHLNGGTPCGCCPIKAGESTTRAAVLDLDSHGGETSWPEMQASAQALLDELETQGMAPVPFRSTGGRGVHIYLMWGEPQDAYSVREFLKGVLAARGYQSGTEGGVANKMVEVFPKQDSVRADGYGNMFILPLAGASEPLASFTGLPEPMGRCFPFEWRTSPPVPLVVKEARPPVGDVAPSIEFKKLQAILAAIPNEGEHELGYDEWRNVMFAIHFETEGSAEGLQLLHDFSARATKYNPEFLDSRGWPYLNQDCTNPITGRTLLKMARANGYIEDCSDEFDILPPLTSEEEAEQVALRERNTAKWESITQAATERKKFEGGRDALEAARREFQKAENEKIGEGEHTVPEAEVLTLETALGRFVFLSDGSRVADIFAPHYDLAFADWAATCKASKKAIPQPDKELSNGLTKKVPDKIVEVSALWCASPRRKTAVTRTFKAGGPLVLQDPEGRSALNTWRPFDRSGAVGNLNEAVQLFLEHIEFLFPQQAERERFLNWLAHIEQQPGILPHTAWLHVAKHFGLGRNWLASVLARVWPGNVAANVDLPAMLTNGFTGRLSRKVLAVVDEIREGGRDSQWTHAERMKSLITEEHRSINPKYGRQSVEFNACRWLMFSNHVSAIPLEQGDRRIEVVAIEDRPRGPDYYVRLYNALSDPQFIAGVATYLGQRDISAFNPGAHACESEAKRAVAQASQTPMAWWCEMLVDRWPSDLISSAVLGEVLAGDGGMLTPSYRRTLEQFGVTPIGGPVKVDNVPVRVSILRNKERWKAAEPFEIREELKRNGAPTQPGLDSPRDFLMRLACEEEEPGGALA